MHLLVNFLSYFPSLSIFLSFPFHRLPTELAPILISCHLANPRGEKPQNSKTLDERTTGNNGGD